MSQYTIDRNAEPSPFFRMVALKEGEITRAYPGRDTVYITSVESTLKQMTGGRVFEASPRNAAMRIVGETHRLSTPEEIAHEAALREREAQRCAEIEEKRKEKSILKPSQEQLDAQSRSISEAVRTVVEQLLPAVVAAAGRNQRQKE